MWFINTSLAQSFHLLSKLNASYSGSIPILDPVMIAVFTCVSYAEARNSYRLDVRLSVRPSVRPSHAGTLSKRLNILSCFLHHTIAHSF